VGKGYRQALVQALVQAKKPPSRGCSQPVCASLGGSNLEYW
jgi:hypothetical protein